MSGGSNDAMVAARDIVVGRLLRDVPDEARRWQIGTATATQLDMAGVLRDPIRSRSPEALHAAIVKAVLACGPLDCDDNDDAMVADAVVACLYETGQQTDMVLVPAASRTGEGEA